MTQWHQQQAQNLAPHFSGVPVAPSLTEHQPMRGQVRQETGLADHVCRFQQQPAFVVRGFRQGSEPRQQAGVNGCIKFHGDGVRVFLFDPY
jgi:hypothetical protein